MENQQPSNIMELYPDKFEIHPITKCWLFTGYLNKKGYGNIRYEGRLVLTHRLSAHISLGLNMNDLSIQVLHKLYCIFPNCANPEHLYLGNNSDNQKDAYILGKVNWQKAKTHCKHGHPLSGDNLYIPKDGRRRCKTCRDETTKLHNQQRQITYKEGK